MPATSWWAFALVLESSSWPVREVLTRVEKMPELHGVVQEDVRAARLKQFRHIVYFVVLQDHVDVLAVLHGARDPAAWQSRV